VGSGASHLPYAPGAASYAASKLTASKITEHIHHENPTWQVFNMHPGVVDTDLARAAGRKADDTAELSSGFAVWLAASPDAKEFNGCFLWAGWDVNELLERKAEIQSKDLLTLTLKGWGEGMNVQEMKEKAASTFWDADKQK